MIAIMPFNTRFDLFSLGPDGQTSPPLSASYSRDHLMTAGDGGFTGPALEY